MHNKKKEAFTHQGPKPTEAHASLSPLFFPEAAYYYKAGSSPLVCLISQKLARHAHEKRQQRCSECFNLSKPFLGCEAARLSHTSRSSLLLMRPVAIRSRIRRHFLHKNLQEVTWRSITVVSIGLGAPRGFNRLHALTPGPLYFSQVSHLCPVHFQVNTRRIYLASCSTRPTPSICAPTLCRIASTGWRSRSRSSTPPWRKVGAGRPLSEGWIS